MTNLLTKSGIFHVLILLLLTSPGLSVTVFAGFAFVPNEKIAILLLLLLSKSCWRQEFRQLRMFSAAVASVLSFLFLIQFFSGTGGLVQASLNSIFIVLSIPLYYSFLSSNSYLVCKAIFFIAVFQMVISASQQYLMLIGAYEVAGMFNNYQHQSVYLFPIGETGFFYRTSGLFYESSGYGVFQWLAIICGFKIGLHKNNLIKVLMIIMIFEVILNGALTGYLFALGFVGINFLNKFRYKSSLINLTVVSICLIIFLSYVEYYGYFDLSGFGPKIATQFDFLSNDYSSRPSRLRGMVESIISALNSNSVLWGVGFSWSSPTLDFYSLYIKAFGIIGFFSLGLYVLLLLRKAPLNYKVAVLLAMSVNGHLSTAINILLVSMPYVMFKLNQISDRK